MNGWTWERGTSYAVLLEVENIYQTEHGWSYKEKGEDGEEHDASCFATKAEAWDYLLKDTRHRLAQTELLLKAMEAAKAADSDHAKAPFITWSGDIIP